MGLWSVTHAKTLIPALAVMVLLGIVLRRYLLHKEEKWRILPLQIIGLLLVLLEIGKQALSLYRGYDLYHLPFHFCSLFIFMVPLMAFYKGHYRQQIRGITAAICASLFLMMIIYPCLIYSEWDVKNYFTDYFSFHTVTFHNPVMLAFVLIPALDIHTPGSKGAIKALLWFVGCFCLVSITMAYLLKTNFAGFYTCNVPFFEGVRLAIMDSVGYVAAQAVYVSVLVVLNDAFVYGAYWAYRGICRLLTKNKKPICV